LRKILGKAENAMELVKEFKKEYCREEEEEVR